MQILTKHLVRDPSDTSSVQRLNDLVNSVAESETFRPAPMMRTLLLYLWQHRGESISEYAIAVEALGRAPSFDPKIDSTVRVQIARLRVKLKEFYAESGDAFPLRLSIPLGRHELQYSYEPPRRSVSATLSAIPSRYLIGLTGFCAAVSVLSIVLLVQNHSLRALLPSQQALPQFWRLFATDEKPTTIIVPSPLFFFWPESGVSVRDLKISDFANWKDSGVVRDLAAKLGPPKLAQTYVGAMEMGTATRILQYLDQHSQSAKMIESRKFSTDSLGSQNTIFIGMPRTAVYLDQLSQKLNFYIAQVDPDVVRSRHPNPGEAAEFKQVDYSADRKLHPAIIALLPARPEHTRSLLLLGYALTGIPAMLTSLDGLRMLEQEWKKAGSPDAFEMVIESELYRTDTVLRLRPVAFRAISPDFWK